MKAGRPSGSSEPEEALVWETLATGDELTAIAARLTPALLKRDPFCLWLCGDLGTGKTTLSGALLYALGLARQVPVTSPTYSYLNEYTIAGARYAHMDLYRAEAGFAGEELGLFDEPDYRGVLVEWPEQVAGVVELAPTHRILINYVADRPAHRHYRLYTVGPA